MEPPRNILYATASRIGGSGLDAVAFETLRVAQADGRLGRALAFDNRQREVPPDRIRTLRWNPVRLLASVVDRPHYYGAKKQALDRAAAAALREGAYDLFHGWSGECVRALREAKRRGVPSVIEIPTWHRNKGKRKPAATRSEREAAAATGWRRWYNDLLVTRQQQIEEYDLADLILVLSEKAEETFLAAGVAPEKLYRHSRGVDPERFAPAPAPPERFTALFVGALIRRKGVHHLLDVWRRLALPDAELVLAGTLHPEIEPHLRGCPNVRLAGFVARVEEVYRAASVHVFPSLCEGSAKATYEAAACGLPQIATRESGDVVADGVNGIVIPADDPDALAEALVRLHGDAGLRARMGAAGRERVLAGFTWGHFAGRLRAAWGRAAGLAVVLQN